MFRWLECKLCGEWNMVSNVTALIIKDAPVSTFNLTDEKTDLKIFECKKCGAVQLYDVPSKQDTYVVHRSIGSLKEHRIIQKNKLYDFISKINYPDKDKFKFQSHLEYGCGDGQYLEIFKELGIDCEGLENNDNNILICKEKGFKNVSFFLMKKYDFIYSFHVLEHSVKPKVFCNTIYDDLNDGGMAFIEVPNYDYIERNNIWLEFTREHIFYYRESTLSFLLLSVGFEIESIKETDGGLTLTAIVRKPVKKGFNGIKNAMDKEIKNIKDLTDRLENGYALVGAGHYTQMLFRNVEREPKYIFDTTPAKIGQMFHGIKIQDQKNIVHMKDITDVIVSCGAYTKDACDNLINVGLLKTLWPIGE